MKNDFRMSENNKRRELKNKLENFINTCTLNINKYHDEGKLDSYHKFKMMKDKLEILLERLNKTQGSLDDISKEFNKKFLDNLGDGGELPFAQWSIDNNISTVQPRSSHSQFIPLVVDGGELSYHHQQLMEK